VVLAAQVDLLRGRRTRPRNLDAPRSCGLSRTPRGTMARNPGSSRIRRQSRPGQFQAKKACHGRTRQGGGLVSPLAIRLDAQTAGLRTAAHRAGAENIPFNRAIFPQKGHTSL
jgi:hypothetical protein